MANSSLCLTPACLEAASRMIWQMATNVEDIDPCTNFDKLVCQRFPEQHPDDLSGLGYISLQNSRVLREILELDYAEASKYQSVPWDSSKTFPTGSTDEANFLLIKKSYEACLDTNAIEAAGAAPLREVISEMAGLWHIDPDDLTSLMSENDYQGLTDIVLYMEEMMISSIVELDTETDSFNDVNVTVLGVSGPDPIIKDTSIFENITAVQEYVNDVTTYLEAYFPGDLSAAKARDIATGIVKLDAHLFAFAGNPVKKTRLRADMVHFHTLDELSDLILVFDIKHVITNLVPDTFDPTRIMTEVDKYWELYHNIFTEFPKTTIQAWLLYKTMSVLNDFIGVSETSTVPRWQACLKQVDESLEHIVARWFASARVPDSTRATVQDMSSRIRDQVVQDMLKFEWMSEDVRKRMSAKAANMVLNIAYRTENPDVRNPESLAEYYKSYNATDNYFANSVAGLRQKAIVEFRGLGKTDRGLLPGSTYVANAFYAPWLNSVNMIASALQLPMMHDDLPSYASYGAIGSVVGHEIYHAFDDGSRGFDENAIWQEWWDNKTSAEYATRAQCIVEQYDALEYDIPNDGVEAVNGTNTLSENLADAAGMRAAYLAWKALDGAKNQDLPGLERFTHDQLFFMFSAAVSCNSYTDQFNDNGWDDSLHAHDTARILGTMANSREFREAFDCPVKEPTCALYWS